MDGYIVIDVSNYDYCLIQLNSGNVYLSSTIDSGAVEGVTDGNAITADNFFEVSATILSDNSISSVIGNQIARLNVVGRYVKLYSPDISLIDKLLVMLAKISTK